MPAVVERERFDDVWIEQLGQSADIAPIDGSEIDDSRPRN
jgi:hypothetical protein